MQQKGIVFATMLPVMDCANVFRNAAESARGGPRYYTPNFDSPFAAIDEVPDYAIGVNILKFNGGGQGSGTHLHMYVDDTGENRSVQLIAKHGLLDSGRAAKLTRRFFETFREADQNLKVTDGNIQF